MISNDTRNNRLNEATKFAQSKKGKVILNRRFQGGVHDIITYCCQNNHEFPKTYHKSVNKKEWCKYWPCNKSKPQYRDKIGFKIFLSRLKTEHQDKIECRSRLPNLPKKQLEFRCKVKGCDEIFFKPIGAILHQRKSRKRPPGCPSCGGSKPITDADVKKITEMLCLKITKKFFDNPKKWNSLTKLPLECPKGHKIPNKNYNKLLGLVKEGKKIVCNKPSCNPIYSKYEIEEVHILAKKKGVIFKDKSFDGNDKPHNWECIKDGHHFPATLSQIRKNAIACPECIAGNLFNSIPKIDKWLKDNEPDMSVVKGEKYRGSNYSIKLYCSICENISPKRPHQIKARSLCNICKGNSSELIVLQYMKQLFGGDWSYNTYPNVINKKRSEMQLDGYCEELGLAFEHHGSQHYEVDRKMKMTLDEKMLRKSKARDRKKEKLCFENGIKLIVINQLNTKTLEQNLKNEIKAQCNGIKTKLYGGFYDKNCKKTFPLPKDYDSIVPFPKSIHTAHLKEQFPEAQQIAKDLNFEILSKAGANLIELQCKLCKGKVTRTTHDFIKKKSKHSCYDNGINFNNEKEAIDLYKKLAKKYQSKFLGIEIDNLGKKRVTFKCLICEKNPNLIQPIHSDFSMAEYSFRSRSRFEKPIIDMKLLSGVPFHPNCGKFSFENISLKDVRKYIKRFEPTAEILTNEKDFSNDRYSEYFFKCSNKQHEPYIFTKTKKLREIKEMAKMNSMGCRKCGQHNSNRPKESYRKNKNADD